MRLALLCLLLASVPALAQSSPSKAFDEVQALTRALPTTDPSKQAAGATRPFNLGGVTAFRVTVCAVDAGATLSGSGSIELLVYQPDVGAWSQGETLTFSSAAAGRRCASWGRLADIRYGWIMPVANTITVSAGTTVRVTVRADTL